MDLSRFPTLFSGEEWKWGGGNRWKFRKQPLFSPLRAQIQECCLGRSNCFVLGKKLLPSSLDVNERIP
jgi:hypothetical protein